MLQSARGQHPQSCRLNATLHAQAPVIAAVLLQEIPCGCNSHADNVDILTLIAHAGLPNCAASRWVGSQAWGASPKCPLHA